MVKSQTDIISIVMITVIAIGLTSTALLWGLPLIQKRQDLALVSRISNFFYQELPSKLKKVQRDGGTEAVTVDAKGIWILNETTNTLTFTFFSKACDKATGKWIGSVACDEGNGFVGVSGIVGQDEPCLVCVRADEYGTGYNITYQLGCRDLLSPDGTRRFRIKLKSGGLLTSTSQKIVISKKGESFDPANNLITTEIEILL